MYFLPDFIAPTLLVLGRSESEIRPYMRLTIQSAIINITGTVKIAHRACVDSWTSLWHRYPAIDGSAQ
jgi:hypothetical protein